MHVRLCGGRPWHFLPLFRPSVRPICLHVSQSVSPSFLFLPSPSRTLQSKTFTIRRISRMHFVPVCAAVPASVGVVSEQVIRGFGGVSSNH